ncbi:hypothetical protein H0H92_000709, partial [Tricholoma furcatifolium]
IDTATLYTAGTSEQYLGKIDWKSKGLKLETKLYPAPAFTPIGEEAQIVTHTPENMRYWLTRSLKAMNTDCLEMWYLHAPDRKVPYEVTLKAVNDLYKEGLFKRFGISNYTS